MESSISGITATQAGTASLFGNFLNGVYNFVFVLIPQMISIFLQATVLFPFLLDHIFGTMFGVDVHMITYPIGSIMAFISVFAIYQMVTGRSFKEGQ